VLDTGASSQKINIYWIPDRVGNDSDRRRGEGKQLTNQVESNFKVH